MQDRQVSSKKETINMLKRIVGQYSLNKAIMTLATGTLILMYLTLIFAV